VYFTGSVEAQELRCNGVDDNCCTKEDPCVENDGDCDYDDQCLGDLLCGEANCEWDHKGDDDDCCFKEEGRCKGEDNGCCTSEHPCKEKDGDCDYNEDCEGDLICGNNNCAWGDHDDCCQKCTAQFRC